MKNIFAFIFSIIFSLNILGSYNIGSYTPNVFKAQNDTQGGRTNFAFNPFVSIDGVWQMPWGHYFVPELGFVYHTDAEDKTSHQTVFLGYNFESAISSGSLFRYGISNFMSIVGGGGEAVVLNNGQSTSTFYAPSESRVSYISSLNIGFKTFFNSNYGFRSDLHVMRFLSSQKRSFGYTLSMVFK